MHICISNCECAKCESEICARQCVRFDVDDVSRVCVSVCEPCSASLTNKFFAPTHSLTHSTHLHKANALLILYLYGRHGWVASLSVSHNSHSRFSSLSASSSSDHGTMTL